MLNYTFILIGGAVIIIGITVLVIVLAHRKSSLPLIVGCSPPCPVGSSCNNNQCVTTTIPCQSDRDCTNHKVCHNPGAASSSCISCDNSQDCQWLAGQNICYNAGTADSKCVQCAGDEDCSHPEVCRNLNCIKGSWVCQHQPGPWYDCSDPLSWPTGCSPKKDNTLSCSYQCQDVNGNVLDNGACYASPAPATTKSDGCGWSCTGSCNEGETCGSSSCSYGTITDYHTLSECASSICSWEG